MQLDILFEMVKDGIYLFIILRINIFCTNSLQHNELFDLLMYLPIFTQED